MADPNSNDKFDKTKAKQEARGQRIGGNDSNTGSGTTLSQGAEFGESAKGQARPGAGSEPRRSMGTHGDEFGQMSDYDRSGQQGQSGTGQADLGSQAGSTLAGSSDQQDLGDVDQPASYGGGIEGRQPNTEGEGFILQQGSGTDDLRQRSGAKSPSSAKASGGTDFAEEGRGASEEQSDEDSVTSTSGSEADDEGNNF